MNTLPLIADFGLGDLIGIIMVILFIVIPAIGQLLAKGNQQQNQPRPRPRPPAGGAGNRPGQAGQDPIQDEIGEFLRRAKRRRAGQQGEPAGQADQAGGPPAGRPGQRPPRPPAAGGRQQTPPPPPPPAQPTRKPAPARGGAPTQPAGPGPQGAEPVQAESIWNSDDSAPPEEELWKGLDDPVFEKREEHFGHDVEAAAEATDQHVHKVFDHQVGSLSTQIGPSPQTRQTGATLPSGLGQSSGDKFPPSAAAGLAAMLGNAHSLRQAIVLREIIERPLDRW
jgi:hypothetical protein